MSSPGSAGFLPLYQSAAPSAETHPIPQKKKKKQKVPTVRIQLQVRFLTATQTRDLKEADAEAREKAAEKEEGLGVPGRLGEESQPAQCGRSSLEQRQVRGTAVQIQHHPYT